MIVLCMCSADGFIYSFHRVYSWLEAFPERSFALGIRKNERKEQEREFVYVCVRVGKQKMSFQGTFERGDIGGSANVRK